MNPFIQATIRLGLLALTCILAGCKTNDVANDGSLASVIITGYSAEEIQRTTIETFYANGFAHPDGLTFEKRGSQWDSVSYGGLDSQPVWIRIRVRLTPRGKVDITSVAMPTLCKTMASVPWKPRTN